MAATAGRAERLIPLRYGADWRSLLFLALLAGLFGAQWTGGLRHWLLLLVTAALAFTACVIKHNHVHCPTFTRRGWNAVLGHVLSLLTGHPTTSIITGHNVRHHGHNNTELDWVRCSLVHFRWNWLNLLAFPFVAVARMRREKPSDLRDWRERRPLLYRQAIAERVVLYGAVAALGFCDWGATLRYLAVPWLFGQWGIVTINLLQHQGCDPASAYDHSRNVTGRLLNWLLLNNGFHTAHHLRPALHWSRLPQLHRDVVEPRTASALNHRSMLAAAWRQFGPVGRRADAERA
jgi:beta-carotene hydroxylase